MKKNKILCIVGTMNTGGAETFLMKIFRELVKKKIYLDFLISSPEKTFYEDEIVSLGGKIYRGYLKSKNPIKSFKKIKTVVQENGYKYVLRMSENSVSTFDLLAAKRGGADCLIMRSTNTKASSKIYLNLLHKLFKFLPKKIVNKKIAPSIDSGKHMFGNKETLILKNGLNTDAYKFDNRTRQRVRKELKLDNCHLMGHVGRFSKQKNHKMILMIFKEYLKINKNSKLLLIGKGELLHEINLLSEKLNISNNIIIIPETTKVNEYLMAMDSLIFPSIYEGLPNVVVEAQTTGLSCLISNTITDEVMITDNVKVIELTKEPLFWAESISEISENKRESYADKVKEQGYDIKEQAKIFQKYVFGIEESL